MKCLTANTVTQRVTPWYSALQRDTNLTHHEPDRNAHVRITNAGYSWSAMAGRLRSMNALKHGKYTASAIAERKRINQVLRDARDFIRRAQRMLADG